MRDLLSIASAGPVPPVDAGDLQRVFLLLTSPDRPAPAGPGKLQSSTTGVSAGLIADQCAADSSPEAAGVRAMLLVATLHDLVEWRTNGELDSIVFETMAGFPLPNGADRYDPSAFIAELRRRTE